MSAQEVELVTIAEAATLLDPEGSVTPWDVYQMAKQGACGRVYRDGARLLLDRGVVSAGVTGACAQV